MKYLLLVALSCSINCLFAQSNINELLSKLRSSKNDSNKVLLYRNISNYYISSRFDSSVYYAEKGMELSRKIKYRSGEFLMITSIAAANQKHGNLNLSKDYYVEAMQGFKSLNDLKGVAICNNGLGVIEGKKGNFNTATKHFLTALRLYEKLRSDQGKVQSYIKLGTVSERAGNLNRALDYYKLAQTINKISPDKETEISILNNTGIVYARKGEMHKALFAFEEGIKHSNASEFGSLHVSLLTNAGNIYSKLGMYKKAVEYHNVSLKKAREFRLPEEEARALLNLASVFKDKYPQKSIENLDTALVISKRISNKELSAEVYAWMSEVYKKQENYKAALAALEQNRSLNDSLFTIEKERAMVSLQSGYDLDKSREHIKTLEALNTKRTFQRNAGAVTAVLVFCFLLLLGLHLDKIRKFNRQLESSNHIKDKLFSIIGHDLRGPVAIISQMLGLMETGGLDEKELKELVPSLKKHTDASLDTLDTLLHWGRTQLKGVVVKSVNFNPYQLIIKNLNVFHSAAKLKMLNIENDVPGSLVVDADPDHFDFVIRNLLSNAIKFTYKGGRITFSAATDEDPDFIRFSVKDNGKGIKESAQIELFQDIQYSSDGTDGEKGTGLGLILSKEFIQANQGKIGVESREGEGSVFYFTLKTGETGLEEQALHLPESVIVPARG